MIIGNGPNYTTMATETKIKVERLRRGESEYEAQQNPQQYNPASCIVKTTQGRYSSNHDEDDDKNLKS